MAIGSTNVSIRDVLSGIGTIDSDFTSNIRLGDASGGDPWSNTTNNVSVGAFRGTERTSNPNIDWVNTSGVAAVTGIQDSDRGLINAWSLVNANGSLDASKSRNVSSVTNVTSGHFRWNWLQPIPEHIGNNYPVMFRGTDDRQSGFGGGDRTLHFYVYNFMNLHSRFSCEARFRYNRDGVGRDWAINHASMMMHLPWDGDYTRYVYQEFSVTVGQYGSGSNYFYGYISPLSLGSVSMIRGTFQNPSSAVSNVSQSGSTGDDESNGKLLIELAENAALGSEAFIEQYSGSTTYFYNRLTVGASGYGDQNTLQFDTLPLPIGNSGAEPLWGSPIGQVKYFRLLYEVA